MPTPPTIRRAERTDLPALLPWCLRAAEQRSALEPLLWPLHPDAQARVQAALERDFSHPERRAWFLAEQQGEVVGVVEAGLHPSPPVYADLLAALTGNDEQAASPEVLPLLLDAAEAFQREGGATLLVAACPADDPQRLTVLVQRGYRPLTRWMIREVDARAVHPRTVRPATEADLPDLVRLNATAQEGKRRANPMFWTPHPDAPARFEAWMRHSLALPDRDMLVAEQNGTVRGFVVVQPASLPPAHDPAGVATLDDLAADDWATFQTLLDAAQYAAAQSGKRAVQAICPADWPQRVEALERAGWRTANLWLMKE